MSCGRLEWLWFDYASWNCMFILLKKRDLFERWDGKFSIGNEVGKSSTEIRDRTARCHIGNDIINSETFTDLSEKYLFSFKESVGVFPFESIDCLFKIVDQSHFQLARHFPLSKGKNLRWHDKKKIFTIKFASHSSTIRRKVCLMIIFYHAVEFLTMKNINLKSKRKYTTNDLIEATKRFLVFVVQLSIRIELQFN